MKRLVFRSMPDETTRAAALKAGEVDIVYFLSGPTAAEIKRTPGIGNGTISAWDVTVRADATSLVDLNARLFTFSDKPLPVIIAAISV